MGKLYLNFFLKNPGKTIEKIEDKTEKSRKKRVILIIYLYLFIYFLFILLLGFLKMQN